VVKQLNLEYNSTCEAHSYYSYIYNSQKLLLYDSSFPTYELPALETQSYLMTLLYEIDSKILDVKRRLYFFISFSLLFNDFFDIFS